jgi:hypothetical protein
MAPYVFLFIKKACALSGDINRLMMVETLSRTAQSSDAATREVAEDLHVLSIQEKLVHHDKKRPFFSRPCDL